MNYLEELLAQSLQDSLKTKRPGMEENHLIETRQLMMENLPDEIKAALKTASKAVQDASNTKEKVNDVPEGTESEEKPKKKLGRPRKNDHVDESVNYSYGFTTSAIFECARDQHGIKKIQGEIYRRVGNHYEVDTDLAWTGRDIWPDITDSLCSHAYKLALKELPNIEELAGPEWVAFPNGALNLRTKEFIKDIGDMIFLAELPYEWDDKISCPETDWEIEELSDFDPITRIQMLEMLGCCLYGDVSTLSYLFLVKGDTGNAKSFWFEMMTAALGKQNVCHVDPHWYCKTETPGKPMYTLKGKMANIYSDASIKPIKETGPLKRATGDETLTAEVIYEKRLIDFRNSATTIVSANKLFDIGAGEDAAAIYRRMRPITFKHEFTGILDAEKKKRLCGKESCQYLIKLAVEAVSEVLERQDTTRTPEDIAEAQKYLRNQDPVGLWLDPEAGDPDAPYMLTRTEAFEKFVRFCRAANLEPITPEALSKALRARGWEHRTRYAKGGDRQRRWICPSATVQAAMESAGVTVEVSA